MRTAAGRRPALLLLLQLLLPPSLCSFEKTLPGRLRLVAGKHGAAGCCLVSKLGVSVLFCLAFFGF